MNTKISFETIDNEIRTVLGEELYTKCESWRNKPSTFGHHWTQFVQEENGVVEYHFTRSACMKVHEYLYNNRDSVLYGAYVGIGGYKMRFKILGWFFYPFYFFIVIWPIYLYTMKYKYIITKSQEANKHEP